MVAARAANGKVEASVAMWEARKAEWLMEEIGLRPGPPFLTGRVICSRAERERAG
jgi:hypothetical protein